MTTPIRDEQLTDAHVSALRLRANGTPDAPNVRLALTLAATSGVTVSSDATSLTITVSDSSPTMAWSGFGRVGAPDVPVVASLPQHMAPLPSTQKFNSRLIVLDPGHGGSDTGAMGNGLVEKQLTLQIARRLRDILLERGWQVMMTRDTDVDVYAPNDSARDELQARCDVANRAGARLFVSIHINSFTSSDLQGTTTYYYKPSDVAFASAIQEHLMQSLGTQNDGVRRENFYVVRHTTMPAVLVETAFLSNASDAARLRQPEFLQHTAQAIGDGITAYASATTSPGGILPNANADTAAAPASTSDDFSP